VRIIADLLYLSGEFNSGNVLGITGRGWVASEALENVCTIQSGGMHTDTNAIESCGRGIGNLANLETFNTTE
jgi:hypothetical protein